MVYKKRFSIVIPTYQSKKQIRNTLEVLNRQKGVSGDDFEVVVVDDGSYDGTGEYIKGINKTYDLKYIYIERSPESSRSKARNTGIMAAEGEIIVFLDADILVKEDYLSQVDSYFKYDRDILLIGHRIMLTEEVTHEDLSRSNLFEDEKFRINKFENFELRHALFLGPSYNSRCIVYPWIHVFSCNMAVRRELLDRSGYFDEGFRGWGLEDVELGYRLYKAGAKVVTGIRIEAFHQPHPTVGSNQTIEDREKEIDANTLHFIEKHPEAMNLPTPLILMFFKGKRRIDYDVMKGFKTPIEIVFRDRSDLESVKAKIIRYSSRARSRAIVFDYVEDTDLDIWIQLLEGVKTPPKYFPMLRGQRMRKIANAGSFVFRFKAKKQPYKANFELCRRYFGKKGEDTAAVQNS